MILQRKWEQRKLILPPSKRFQGRQFSLELRPRFEQLHIKYFPKYYFVLRFERINKQTRLSFS
jgi:hypothetical protein